MATLLAGARLQRECGWRSHSAATAFCPETRHRAKSYTSSRLMRQTKAGKSFPAPEPTSDNKMRDAASAKSQHITAHRVAELDRKVATRHRSC